MNGLEADTYELRLNYSKEVLAKSVCQNGAKERYLDTHLNCQQLGNKSLKSREKCSTHIKKRVAEKALLSFFS